MTSPAFKSIKEVKNKDDFWFTLTIIFIIFDYGRPQVVFPFIGIIRPLMIIILLLSWYLIRSGFITQLKIRQIKLMWLFIILLFVYVPFARNNYYAYKTALAQILYMPFILSIIFCVNSFYRLKKIILIFVSVMIYVAIYGIFHHGRGPGNYFLDENDLSLYINTWLPFCYFLFFSTKSRKDRMIYGSGLFFGLLAVITSFSRGGFVGLLGMSTIVWWSSQKKIRTIIVFLCVVILLLIFVDPSYWKEMSTVTNTKESTASERIKSWATAWDMFIDNPLGVGGSNFQVRFPEYQKNRFSRGMWGRVAHSLWFTLIPELGLFGIYIYLAILIRNFKDILKIKKFKGGIKNDKEKTEYFQFIGSAFLASLAGFFTSATFLSVLYYAHYWYLTGLVVAAVRVVKNVSEQMKSTD